MEPHGTPTRGEHPVPENQFTHGKNPWSSWFGIDFSLLALLSPWCVLYNTPLGGFERESELNRLGNPSLKGYGFHVKILFISSS